MGAGEGAFIMAASRFLTAQIVRKVAEAASAGEKMPVGYVAEKYANTFSRDDVFLSARAAGYRVEKRKGVWFELVEQV